MSGAGYKIKAAVKRAAETSVYGTAAATVTNQIPLISEGITASPKTVGAEALVGNAGQSETDVAAIDKAGPISCEAWYESLEPLIFAALGYECPDESAARDTTPGLDAGGSPAPDTTSGPDAFLHIFEPDDNLHREVWGSGEREASGSGDYVWTSSDQKVRTVSVCIDKTESIGGSSVEHFVDCAVNSMTIKGSVDGGVTIDFDLIPRSSEFTGSSTGFALPDPIPGSTGHTRRFKFSNLYCYVGDVGASIGGQLPISDFEFKVDNGLKADDYDTGGQDSSAGLTHRTEPVRNDKRKTTLKLSLARMNADTIGVRERFEENTTSQITLYLVGPSIDGSSEYYRMGIVIPTAKIKKAEFPVAGPGVITGDVEATAELSSDPATTYALDWITDFFDGVRRVKMQEFFILLENTRGSCFSRDRNTTYPIP